VIATSRESAETRTYLRALDISLLTLIMMRGVRLVSLPTNDDRLCFLMFLIARRAI
jgi:hypothetical protein